MNHVWQAGDSTDLIGYGGREGQVEATCNQEERSTRSNAGDVLLVEVCNLLRVPGRFGRRNEIGNYETKNEEYTGCGTTTGTVVLNSCVA